MSDGGSSGRGTPFPREFQGHWVEEHESSLEMIIDGSEMSWRGDARDYVDKKILVEEDFIEVTIEFDYRLDSGDDLNLAWFPEDVIAAYDDHFAAHFVRKNS